MQPASNGKRYRRPRVRISPRPRRSSASPTNITWRKPRMNFDTPLLSPESRAELETTVLVRHRLEEQYESLEHQHQASTLGIWLFLATEAMFFGALFLAFGTY